MKFHANYHRGRLPTKVVSTQGKVAIRGTWLTKPNNFSSPKKSRRPQAEYPWCLCCFGSGHTRLTSSRHEIAALLEAKSLAQLTAGFIPYQTLRSGFLWAPLTQLLKGTLLKGVNSLITKNRDKSQRQIRKLKIIVSKGISSWQRARVTELSSTRCRQK